MTWDTMLFLSIAGTAITFGLVAWTAWLGIRYRSELPKLRILDSIAALTNERSALEARLAALDEQLSEAQRAIREASEANQWLEENRSRITDLQEELVRLEASKKRHLSDIEHKAGDLREVESKLADAVEEHNRIDGVVRDLETRQAVLETKLKGEEDIIEQLDALRSSRSELRDELAVAGKELERTTRELDELQGGRDRARQELEDMREQHRDVHQKHLVLQAEVAQMESERDHLQRQVESLTVERTQVAPPESASVEERTAALWTPPVHRPDDLGEDLPSHSSEKEVLDQAVARIRDSGLIFPDRSIHALHTGLKVAMESPLLVLAGISGTGKSALPRRYAEAMGMHFLNVPVQPGWDSPMDFVGFYNHLEGRFKPTELTRALIQMDAWGTESNRWPEGSDQREDLSSGMLIVLLDEMNLARIEYYFSDFLSKLEIRRDVDPANVRQRRAAEIALEIGKSGTGSSQSLPLFVGENVLFVGTINEDESTQTMSDKVIDRSNVMRFGRPRKLEKGEQGVTPPLARALPARVWKEWRTATPPLAEEEYAQVEGWIQTCNNYLDEIGRPFAHRTAQIMREYVRHYPRWAVNDPVRVAMADQVEMQVLPRLRGIDPQQERESTALSNIQRLVEELGDEPLGKAIERTLRRSESHLFLWQGVDRLQDEVPSLLDA